LRRSEKALRQKKHHLEEANPTLKALLRQREEDRRKIESDVLDNMRRKLDLRNTRTNLRVFLGNLTE
jgi:hypothetical protein